MALKHPLATIQGRSSPTTSSVKVLCCQKTVYRNSNNRHAIFEVITN